METLCRSIAPHTALMPILFVLLLSACSREVAPTAQLDPPVRVVSIGNAGPLDAVTATGLVRVSVEAPLSFKTPGIIAEMRVDAGQQVSAGQVLASLVMTDLDAQRTQAQEQVAKTERDLARTESLRVKGMISQQAEQDVRAQRDIARAALAATNFNYQQAVLTAPSAGLILDKRADARETVAAGQPVVLFGRLDKGWVVRAGLPAKEAVKINLGDKVKVFLDTAALGALPLQGQVKRVAGASDPRTGSIEVEVALASTKERLVSGMVARLEFARAANKQTAAASQMSLPLSAVLEGNSGRAKVFVLDASKKKVKQLSVHTGRLLDNGIEILEGLPADAMIVSEGAAWLSDGDAVRVLP
ncbi:MAG: efflux RND transporter periplasmic adaptor subunit [Rhodocyclaceae bacterium]|nr:efflux RND transporter periplasmic adaptor subunit [Rhodocyclaceae bacterium]MBP6278223.1 efflux RND transporter periplasmic adaptor subunit [Rhodocyclaceae bacterium]